MTEQVVKTLTDPSFLIAMLVGIAVFATVFTLMPAFGGTSLKSRMKSVALERDRLRAEQRARLASEADRRRKFQSFADHVPAGRVADPAAIAHAILAVALNPSITGSTLLVDGGDAIA